MYLSREDTCFGFNLYKRKGDDRQYIGDIDIGSPAAIVGLKAGDMLIEVTDIKIDDMINIKYTVKCTAVFSAHQMQNLEAFLGLIGTFLMITILI